MKKEEISALKVLAQSAMSKDPEVMISYNDFIFLKAYCELLEKQIAEMEKKNEPAR